MSRSYRKHVPHWADGEVADDFKRGHIDHDKEADDGSSIWGQKAKKFRKQRLARKQRRDNKFAA